MCKKSIIKNSITLTFNEIKEIIRTSLGKRLPNNAVIILSDPKYIALSENKVNALYRKSGVKNMQ